MGDWLRGSGGAMAPWLALTLVLSVLGLGLGPVAAQRGRPLAALAVRAPEGLEQILGDGQPEDIGYGYQRDRSPARATRTGQQSLQGLLLLGKPAAWQDDAAEKRARPADVDADEHSAPSAFRERMASRQRRQRAQQQQQQQLDQLQMQQQQLQQQQWGDWRRDSPGVSSFYPAGGPAAEPVDNPERYLQALREAWVRYQQQTGTIDVGPDDLTDLETLQFLEALGEDLPGAKKRTVAAPRPAAEHQGTSSLDWAAPLVWSGYQLRKRSTSPDEDDADDWDDRADDSGVLDDDEYPASLSLASAPSGPSGPSGPAGNRLAMLLTEQLFDERYNDPAVKRLLLTKRSAQRQDDADELGLGHAMRRRKKSTRPALVQAQGHAETAPNVQKDLARIFGDPELGDGEPEPPLALPLAAAAATTAPASAPTATATTTAVPNKNATKQADGGQRATASAPTSGSVPLNPIGHAHETDKIARQHAQHPHQHAAGAASNSPNTQVHVHEEHAPPMVAAEGPHGHDQAVHADKDKPAPPQAGADGVPVGAAAGAAGAAAGADGEQEELPIPLALSRHRRIAKKSIDWSQYFGLDRRRKKSTESSDEDNSIESAVDADWMLRHNLMGFKSATANGINKRVAVKKEGASPDDLLAAKRWDEEGGAVTEDDEEGMVQPGSAPAARTATFWARDTMGRCPAVARLAQSCRSVVGRDNGLVPICVLYHACHMCGPYVGLPEGSSCATELQRLGTDICTSSPHERECRMKVTAVARLYASVKAAEQNTCAEQPCLAYFFLTAPAVAFA